MKMLAALMFFPVLALAQEITWIDRPDDPELKALQERYGDQCLTRYHSNTFPSLNITAAEVLGRIYLKQPEFEYAGTIVELNGEYRASVAVTNGGRNSVKQGCIAFPKGWRLVGFYHTHSADSSFSKADRRHVQRFGVPSYIATMRDGQLLRYDPETRKAVEVGDMDEIGGAQVRVTWTSR